MARIIITGKPISKARPRFARRGKFVIIYSAQETKEGRWLWEAKGQVDQCFEGPLYVICHFYMPRPKGHYGTGKNTGKVKANAPSWHIKKPDTDNLIKWCLDCLNGIAWKDDCQIVSISGQKEYSELPRTEIVIKAL